MPNPDIESIPFPTLDALTEAAEKYEVYPAMNTSGLHDVRRIVTASCHSN